MTRPLLRALAPVAYAVLLSAACGHTAPPGEDERQARFYDGVCNPLPPRHPQTCPALPSDSPLNALASKAPLDGCRNHVQLRPGRTPDADVLFTCPGSKVPVIVLHGRGKITFRRPTDPDDQQRLRNDLVRATRGLVDAAGFYDREQTPKVRSLPPPPCGTYASGAVMSIHDYDSIDEAVAGLRRWIQANDLDIELVLRIVPESDPHTEC